MGWRAEAVVTRYRGKVSRMYFRADAGFANPEVYEYLEAERIKHAIRLPANRTLQIGYLLTRPVGRPPNEVRRLYANFTYQAGSWTKPRRVVAKVERHPGELYPRVGFIVTNMARPAENVVAFYNKRGKCEQWIKEGKGAIKWTSVMPLVRRQRGSPSASCARVQSRQFPAHVGDAGADQGLVTHEPEAETHKDWRESLRPRPLCRLSDGGGLHSEKSLRRHLAADRGIAAAAHRIGRPRRLRVMRSLKLTGEVRLDVGKFGALWCSAGCPPPSDVIDRPPQRLRLVESIPKGQSTGPAGRHNDG